VLNIVRKEIKIPPKILKKMISSMISKGLEELVHLRKLYLTRNRIQVLEGLHNNKKLQVYI
jgi:alanine racemase